ncbi:MAG: AAA family ATPase [Candidatus Thiodiazotropha sp. (ex Epidulcina cf. delphinae)]|nr:AAA family ATPase [Candidatus Thiodiazotropha sp. (ex Epidulcina cf. delphinae)]
MLTRLKINGFKNLVDVDVHFGPFTCIAGANGVGKSNLFDAIRFLSALADISFLEAAHLVRDEEGLSVDIRGLFHRAGNKRVEKMTFEAEMIVPRKGNDHLGQLAEATTTFLRYKLELSYCQDTTSGTMGVLELVHESLDYIKKGEASRHLPFKHSAAKWRASLGLGKRSSPFISTEAEENRRIIKLHQDGGSRGKPRSLLAESLPRTVLSDSNASESPTALLARLEMRSWRLLQLEPTALRKPDEFTAPGRLGMDGAHLAKSLYAQANVGCNPDQPCESSKQVYAQVTNSLSQLLDDVREVKVDRDEKRELLTLKVAGKDGVFHPARSLSDGTLRFLALAVLELERMPGVLCFEEPENGIHPQRIEAMLELLQDIAMDTSEPVDDDNPLRQVIINTHSPSVVLLVPADSLIVADLQEQVDQVTKTRFTHACFSCLPETWRQRASKPMTTVSLGKLLSYLNPLGDNEPASAQPISVKAHLDTQMKLKFC